jgi:hypothetical protein
VTRQAARQRYGGAGRAPENPSRARALTR